MMLKRILMMIINRIVHPFQNDCKLIHQCRLYMLQKCIFPQIKGQSESTFSYFFPKGNGPYPSSNQTSTIKIMARFRDAFVRFDS